MTEKNVFIAPEWEELKYQYQLAWDIKTRDMIDTYAIWQKWCGQGISADLYIKFSDANNRKVSGKQLIMDFLYATEKGLKTRYYYNSATGTIESEERGCAGGGCVL